ncbi:polysaccharide pyruvyl transferase family protein [Desulfoscipio sp. XC116]|uniref:polysaccharide pyruvyl transferase family protein n=1 Tax=Desulfoscipio sp. XC116 TaxID=3144975 RepID=UPI00325A8382
MKNKKSIGVITYFAYNYGAFLQAYALQKTMKNIGFDCELINYDYMRDRTLLGIPWSNINKPIKFCASVLKKLVLFSKTKKRTAIMKESVYNNLHFSKQRYKSAQQLRESPPQYDIYLTGSDQVWNPTINAQGFETRLLDFVYSSQGKLVSYAASIGLAEFPTDKIALTKEYLTRFDAISVREEEAKNILAPFIDKDVQRHVDPTLLREKKDWLEFGKPITEIQGPYIFVYMLANQPKLVKYANDLSKKLNLKILSVGNGMAFQNRILSDKSLSPEQFVWGIANAEYVVANSFHGTCFSVLFKKKARIFIPPTVQCRIVELIEGCNLSRLLEDVIIKNSDVERLYLGADKYLAKERKRAYEYLMHLKDLE